MVNQGFAFFTILPGQSHGHAVPSLHLDFPPIDRVELNRFAVTAFG